MTSDAKKKANAKYDKENTVFIGLKLNKNTDADAIEFLDKQKSKQGTIKALLKQAAENDKVFNYEPDE